MVLGAWLVLIGIRHTFGLLTAHWNRKEVIIESARSVLNYSVQDLCSYDHTRHTDRGIRAVHHSQAGPAVGHLAQAEVSSTFGQTGSIPIDLSNS